MRSVVEIGANVPAFLAKLWKLVNDSDTNHLISWSSGGKTFVLKNQAEFARELLPLYYKHNNMASFIRQLNMYGFHKVTSVENNALRYEKDEIEFTHPCFMRGHAYLLEHIKRKIPNPKAIVASSENGEKILVKPEMMNKVLADVKQMKGKQETLDAKFSAMKQENEALWREVAILRQKHIKQQQIVNNLIQFLMSLVQPTRSGTSTANGVGVKRPYQLMINSQAHNSTDTGLPTHAKNMKLDKETGSLEEMMEDNLEDGPTIHELAHDDILHSEASQDASHPIDYVTIEVPSSLNNGQQNTIQIPITQYHVTMEDGEDLDSETARVMKNAVHKNSLLNPTDPSVSPVVTSPSPVSPNDLLESNILTSPGTSKSSKIRIRPECISTKTLSSPRSFNVINPSADLKLPAEIFASDDSVSDAGNLVTEESVDSFLQNPLPTKDKMLGGINIKVEKPESTNGSNKKNKKFNKDNITNLKLEDIKTELQDELDWNNMSLATVNNNMDINKYKVNRRDFISKNVEDLSSLFGTKENKSNIDNHLDSMQTDLESLKELLRSDSYALDTNTLMGLFGADDPFYGLSYNPVDERTKTANNADGTNQLISYTGNIPDFDDIDIDLEGSNSLSASPAPQSSLNTPQVSLASPAFNRQF